MSTSTTELIRRARANPAPLSRWEADFLVDMERLDTGRRDTSPTPAQIQKLRQIADRVDRVDLAELNACLAERIQSITEELIGSDPTSKHGHTVRFRTKGSLAVVVSGKDRGAFFDHEAKVRGGPLELVRLLRNEPINLTIQWARAKVGAAVPAIIPARREISVEKQRSPSATLPLARQY